MKFNEIKHAGELKKKNSSIIQCPLLALSSIGLQFWLEQILETKAFSAFGFYGNTLLRMPLLEWFSCSLPLHLGHSEFRLAP